MIQLTQSPMPGDMRPLTAIPPGPSQTNPPIREALREWLVTNIAAVLEIDPATIDGHRNLDEYGLDSMQSVCLSGDLEAWLGTEVPPTAIWDYPTIDSLCDYLAEYATAQKV